MDGPKPFAPPPASKDLRAELFGELERRYYDEGYALASALLGREEAERGYDAALELARQLYHSVGANPHTWVDTGIRDAAGWQLDFDRDRREWELRQFENWVHSSDGPTWVPSPDGERRLVGAARSQPHGIPAKELEIGDEVRVNEGVRVAKRFIANATHERGEWSGYLEARRIVDELGDRRPRSAVEDGMYVAAQTHVRDYVESHTPDPSDPDVLGRAAEEAWNRQERAEERAPIHRSSSVPSIEQAGWPAVTATAPARMAAELASAVPPAMERTSLATSHSHSREQER